MTKTILAALATLFLLAGAASAQTVVRTQPYGTKVTDASSTIAVTDAFQTLSAAPSGGGSRSDCLIQNNGTNTMWIYIGSGTPAKTSSVTLAKSAATYGGVFRCANAGVTPQDTISITGTATETFTAWIE